MNVLANAIEALDETVVNDQWLVGDGECGVGSENETADKALPTITIQTEQVNDDRVAIRIRDNGPGMPEAVRKRLFDPFFTTKPVGQGTGLGLSISYQIVTEKHKGTLQCFSEPGQGSEFRIEIPMWQSEG
jgi:two-component system, NtrC family, sensor kinase